MRVFWLTATFGIAVGLDYATKAWTQTLTEPVQLADWLWIWTVTNPELVGGPVDISGYRWAYAIGASGLFLWCARGVLREPLLRAAAGYALLAAAVAGNGAQMAGAGVTDFVVLQTGPVISAINLADVWAAAGLVLLGSAVVATGRAARARSGQGLPRPEEPRP